MNKFFLGLFKGVKNTAKYVIFSAIFVLSCFIGVDFVDAASMFQPVDNSFAANNAGITGANALTSVSGKLYNGCTYVATEAETNNNYYGYTIVSSSYQGNNSNTNKNCITYSSDGTNNNGTQTFYLQAKDHATDLNTITFSINVGASLYNYVTVFETRFSASANTLADYDMFSLTAPNATTYSYQRQVGSAVTDTKTGTLTAVLSSGNYILTFTYDLRDDTYNQEHMISVYFYDANPKDTAKETRRAELKYTLAKPISDYSADANQSITYGTSLVDCSGDKVCVTYNKNAGTTVDNVHLNNFHISVPEKVAMYFSTYNTHTHTSEELNVDNIKKYNSVYAINTFTNEGETADKIIYYYYNVKDISEYLYALTVKDTTDYYKFVLTIDASGNYQFVLIDIFGNQLTFPTDGVEIDDVANRDLTIYYLVYNSGVDKNATTLASGQFEYGTEVDLLELKTDLAALTNENVTFGLEFYYKIKISGDYGVGVAGHPDKIKLNPLYYDTTDTANPNKQIKMGSDASNPDTYYCRLKNTTSDCVTTITGDGADEKNSAFIKKMLKDTQTISGNATTGIKDVTNTFTFIEGIATVKDPDGIATGIKKNRVNITVNENGKYNVKVSDTLQNLKSSTIDISIIDQLKPVIVASNNNICSSMYVIGAGGTIQIYPSGDNPLAASDCAVNNVVYDHYEDVDLQSTELEAYITRGGTLGDATTDTNGFYNTGTTSVAFNYADAIRMALLRVTDSGRKYGASGGAFEKSIYEKSNNTYTDYKLWTLGTAADRTVKADITSSGSRFNFANDYIIADDITQYSSELKAYRSGEYVVFYVSMYKNGTGELVDVCNTETGDLTECYNVVNTYIDKAINFQLKFKAIDYVGNVSNEVAIKITVIDDTNPGVYGVQMNGESESIFANNMATICRLEIGSVIHNKNELLECYGFMNSDSTYNFVDNATGYSVITKDTYQTNLLTPQLYSTQLDESHKFKTYAESISVYICLEKGEDGCDDAADWELVSTLDAQNEDLKFNNAGSYQIKFVIKDTGKDYLYNDMQGGSANTTTIIACYYVNPRVLLLRPQANQSKVYGAETEKIEYCLYATTNTRAFYYNLFNIPAGNADDYADTYDFVAKNYEDTTYGRVYCSDGDYTNSGLGSGQQVDLSGIMINSGAGFKSGTGLKITYATGNAKHKLELGEETYNAYEDAGYYRITMGDLAIVDTHKDNYVLRLHPSYLLDGEIPNTGLVSYNDESLMDDDHYKYGVNTNSHGETISNVLYTIKQAELTIQANGGSKYYGNKDTNFSNALSEDVSKQISQLSYKYLATSGDADIATTGYLGGFTVSGFINDQTSGAKKLADFADNRYVNILKGALRRRSGETAGTYFVCMTKADFVGNSITNDSCNISLSENGLITNLELTSANVYRLVAANDYDSIGSSDAIVYGMYVKVGSIYYKLTRNNVISGTGADSGKLYFVNYHESNLWSRSYDDSLWSIYIDGTSNSNNGNDNYYITYTGSTYNILPRTLIVQPGANQGKEYSNPTHNDPIYEIVVYGETQSITAASSGFNGFTETIADIEPPTAPTHNSYGQVDATADTVKRVADSELYFNSRRTRTTDINSTVKYLYKFTDTLNSEKQFKLDDIWYVYNSAETTKQICPVYNTANDSECIKNGEYIGIHKITITGNDVVITWDGVLTYQHYGLFTSDGDTAGSGFISRDQVYTEGGEKVAWYEYKFDATKLRAKENDNEHCTLVSSATAHTYSVGGTSKCANYNVTFTDMAPSKKENEFEYTTSDTAPADGYLHNGVDKGDSGVYSVGYTSNKIKFSIFKRDIILSFNNASQTYGNVYSHYESNNFAITDNGEVPSILTCYARDVDGKYVVNGVKYSRITAEECAEVDHGLSQGDTWGTTGLDLDFYLNSKISTNFATNYAVPAGLYYVYAHIGGTDKVHENYNLIYIDYYVIKDAISAGATANSEDGALKITEKEVKLVGTYYQKEYGQFVYATYGNSSNALSVVTTGTEVSGVYSTKLDTNVLINIFDDNYYHCGGTDSTYNGQSLSYGCFSTSTLDSSHSNAKYKFDEKGNVYAYTVTGMVNLTGSSGKVDEIAANFKGSPSRSAGDNFGILDDAGFYSIDLSAITPVVATYTWLGVEDLFTVSDGTIYRYNNYKISTATDGRVSGGLYITPAQIEITVAASQKKMYGCAYNTFDTDVTNSIYDYATGYADCIETFNQNYDLGYKYTVNKDKKYYIAVVGATYAALVGNTCDPLEMSNRETGACSDVSYTGSNYSYDVIPNYTNEAEGDTPTNGQKSTGSLNGGTLYRLSATADKTFNYKTYFGYAANAQLATGNKFQEQKVGTYVITLGNLDAAFNANNHCNANSMPVSSGAESLCKNFIVNYGGNNTSTHTKTGTTDKFLDDAQFTLSFSSFKFEITERKVVITTEYNYKVHGDTEPNEGYRCSELASIFTYSYGYNKDFNYNASVRAYCNNSADTFISTGVSRFYALDNSLAKAPWTSWVDYNENNYKTYDDTLFDVLHTSSELKRKGEGANNPAKGDSVGRYYYVFDLKLNDGTTASSYDAESGFNYTIAYLNKTDATNDNETLNSVSDNKYMGFAATRTGDALVSLDRWYKDENHLCIGQSSPSVNSSCDYSGSETLRFVIKGINNSDNSDRSINNAYTVSVAGAGGATETITSALVSEVYFEIVRREIFVQTLDVEKVYGVEEKYTDFTVALCSEYNETTKVCTPVGKTNQWGVRNSLSKEDYEKFYTSTEPASLIQANFKGSNTASDFRGTTTGTYARAFGIYFYRTMGEVKGTYVIVACSTQFSGDNECREYYQGLAAASGKSAEEVRLETIHSFTYGTTSNDYNASNYIVKTIPALITIGDRTVSITPDSGQGFQYGNYETGKQIAPITFTEKYYDASSNEYKGLVNGALMNPTTDSITNQLAICLYDISQQVTCINDRQNSSGGTIKGYVITSLHGGDGTVLTATSSITNVLTGSTIKVEGRNVYNDNYTEDNDDSRYALNRKLSGSSTRLDERYNRNVGVYEITIGDFATVTVCDATTTVNCLDRNYNINVGGFTTGVTYTITQAEITVTPLGSQAKVYGKEDVHLKFEIQVQFSKATVPADLYYCSGGNCQNIDDVVTYTEFAYEENMSGTYNYGKSLESNKASAEHKLSTDFASDSEANPKYYDKYCYTNPDADQTCVDYDAESSHAYASLKYGVDTSRILLGYFYVQGWTQKVGTHNILSGIIVAKNEFGNQNYKYVDSFGGNLVSVGDDTGVDFVINQLQVNATIKDVTKTYGQATDSHKCDSGVAAANCAADYASLIAEDNEGRLEYNFDVSGDGVNTVGNDVLLTVAVADKYYTQSSLPEYKNIHLGLTVVRAIHMSSVPSGETKCISTIDQFGCEDVGEYTLVFRKQDVAGDIDKNYKILLGSDTDVSTTTTSSDYATVIAGTVTHDETNGDAGNSMEYIVYSNSSVLDTPYNNQNSADTPTALTIDIYASHTAKLTITKRNIEFHIGTYNESDGSVNHKYVIEQNEQVPEFPELNSLFTVYGSTDPVIHSRQVHYNTWYDQTEYVAGGIPFRVRTGDKLVTTVGDVYGIAICKNAVSGTTGVFDVEYTDCESNALYYADVNQIENGAFKFSTATIGYYPMFRDKTATFIQTADTTGNRTALNENRNYDVNDVNGVLVIYEDRTAPTIQVGNTTFVIEANADSVKTCVTVRNSSDSTFYYNCEIVGKTFEENSKELGAIIKFITEKYSKYDGSTSNKSYISDDSEDMPATLTSGYFADKIYQPVNNIGIVGGSGTSTSLYDKYRYQNNYEFDDDYIDSYLRAVTSIISWFNINSFDYSYVRGNTFDSTKRYTPRYYFYIEGITGINGGNFDPTYVGDFTIKIYAIDDVGNITDTPQEVTLQIVDTTKPIISEAKIFNVPVICLSGTNTEATAAADNNCKVNNFNDWYVKSGKVSIDAFIKYRKTGGTFVEDNVKGTYIYLGTGVAGNDSGYIDIYGVHIKRYLTPTSTTTNVLGGYVEVQAGKVPAIHVEHKYWSNIKDKYLVIVGGEDNSYIDPAKTDTNSQWNTYYTINGDVATPTWYKYDRHAHEGVKLQLKDGVTTIVTRVLDSGRKFTVSDASSEYEYYNNMYLRKLETGMTSSCQGLSDCSEYTGNVIVTQVKDLPTTYDASTRTYTFNLQSLDVTYVHEEGNIMNGTATWFGNEDGTTVSAGEFAFGIMVCKLTNESGAVTVDCQTDYKVIYKNSDKKSLNIKEYTVTNQRNIGDWYDDGDGDPDAAAGFYKDRRYIFIDTGLPTLTIEGQKYSVYEYDTKCAVGQTDELCALPYKEKFVDAADGLLASGDLANSIVNATAVSVTDITTNLGKPTIPAIAWHDGGAFTNSATLPEQSGILKTNDKIMDGANVVDRDSDPTALSQFNVSLSVYVNIQSATANKWYRFIAVYNGEKYYIYRQVLATSYTDELMFDTTKLSTYTTIEAVLEYIVSTESVSDDALVSSGNAVMITYSINYNLIDAAGNVSADSANNTIRGVTLTKLSTTVAAAANVGVAMQNLGDNRYQLSINQGMSLSAILDSITVSNVDLSGNNNLSSVRQSLYYNGVALYENIGYNSDILATIENYLSAPGTYTLRLTSQREVVSGDKTFLVNDKPLELNFVVEAPRAITSLSNDYSRVIVTGFALMLAGVCLLAMGYVVSKRKQDK